MTLNDNNVTRLVSAMEHCGALSLLEEESFQLTPRVLGQLAAFIGLVNEWNNVAGLVSEGDLALLVENHLVDSISLAPIIKRLGKERGVLLDIGSGGGFPAVPLKVLLPELAVLMVERSERKVGFLIKVLGDLGLSQPKVIHGNFSEIYRKGPVDIITARAVEKGKLLLRQVTRWMPVGSVFLVQSGLPKGLGPMFHVEHVQDKWQQQGLRRGEVYLVKRI